jgi:hypothetical protein
MLADRFLAERAVSVVVDRAVEERGWSTPELLAVEQQLVTAANDRTGEQTAVASHQAVREALAAHPTAGADQLAMFRDCTVDAILVRTARPCWTPSTERYVVTASCMCVLTSLTP